MTPIESPAIRFAQVARTLGAALHREKLPVPAFRSPPRAAGATRTVRRYEGGATVAVRLRDREPLEWITDMVLGALVAARRPPGDALAYRLLEECCLAAGVPVPDGRDLDPDATPEET